MIDIQSALNELTKKTDTRISVFEIEIQELRNSTLSLSGRVLRASQLEELRRLLPLLDLDLYAVRVLEREQAERVHVGTNFTGLYEKPTFGMPLSSELTYGTELEVLDVENRWVFTRQQDGYLGWAYRPYLAEGAAPAASHMVIAPSHELRAEPDIAAEVITRLMSGTGVVVEELRRDWARVIANQSGWIPSRYLRSSASLPKTVEERRQTLLADSQRMTGVPYLWGGLSGNGIDCSGFTRLLHRWIGIDIPRDADMQCEAARPVEPPFEVGDLFFFAEPDDKRNISHVGLSLGGWRMIHSSRSRNGVYVDDLNERKSLMEIFVSAGSFLRES
jgi:gamma-D-glutamyl-L-lysine dipeptidyl-peptidase